MALLRTLEGRDCLGKNGEGKDPDNKNCGLKATADVTDPDPKVVKSMEKPALSSGPSEKEKAKVVKSSGAKAGGPKPHGIGRGGARAGNTIVLFTEKVKGLVPLRFLKKSFATIALFLISCYLLMLSTFIFYLFHFHLTLAQLTNSRDYYQGGQRRRERR